MAFLYPLLNFIQPGIVWPALATFKPMLVISILALVVGLLRTSSFPRAEAFRHPLFVWIATFVVVQVISVYSAGVTFIVAEFFLWIVYLLFLIVSCLLIVDEKALSRYVFGMMFGSMVIVIFGILAVVNGWPEASGGRAGAYGMYENHNDYSFIIIQILPFLILLRPLQSSFLLKLLMLAATFGCFAGIALSLSRGGMLALVAELFLIVLVGMTSSKRWLFVPILIVIGGGAISYQWSKRAENQGDGYTAEHAENSRMELWRAASRMVQDRPLLGVGSRRYSEFARSYGEISHDNRGKNTHNTYLEVLTGTGLIGFLAFLSMAYQLVKITYKKPAAITPFLDGVRRATFIAFCAIALRALLDAKPHDWSFYILSSIALAYTMLQRQSELAAACTSTHLRPRFCKV